LGPKGKELGSKQEELDSEGFWEFLRAVCMSLFPLCAKKSVNSPSFSLQAIIEYQCYSDLVLH